MSVKFFPKQLPSDHIAQRRFSPYQKANSLIRHLEKAKYAAQSPAPSSPSALSPTCKCKTSQSKEGKVYNLTPLSRLNKKMQQKIEIINSFNNLSCSKTQKHKKRTCANSSPTSQKHRVFIKIEKKNYHLLVNKAFNDNTKPSVKESLPLESNQSDESKQSKLKSRQQSRCKSQDKITSTRASERWEIPKDYGLLDVVLRPDGIKNERIMNRCRERHRRSEEGKDLFKGLNRFVKKTLDFEVELKDIMCISPILDLNRCNGFNY